MDTDNNKCFKDGDRFYHILSINDVKNPQGTVLFKRRAYGSFNGGTYMVKYDDSKILTHNAVGIFMKKLDN